MTRIVLIRAMRAQASRLSRRAMSGPEPPQVTWMLTSDAWPNARWPRGPDFTAFHGELLVGRVFQHQEGPEKGLWFWTMSVERPSARTSTLELQSGPWNKPGQLNHAPVFATRVCFQLTSS